MGTFFFLNYPRPHRPITRPAVRRGRRPALIRRSNSRVCRLNIIGDHPNRRLARSKAALTLLLMAHTQRTANVTDDAGQAACKETGGKRVALHHAGRALGHPQIALAQLANLDQVEIRAIDLPRCVTLTATSSEVS